MVERKSKDIVKSLTYTDKRVGTDDNYTVDLTLSKEGLAELQKLTGQRVTATINKEVYQYQYLESENQSFSVTNITGILTQVTSQGVTMRVESGETKYPQYKPELKATHKHGTIVNAPFYHKVYQLRQYAEIVKTDIMSI